MSRRTVPFASALFALALSVAPAAPAALPGAAAVPTLGASDDGRAMTLRVGTGIRVDLDANPSTGAAWQRRDAFGKLLASVPCEGVVREPLVKPGGSPPVGAGITVSYCFRAAAPGRAFLYLFYGRGWDPAAPAWSRFNLDVTVTPAD